MPRFSVATVLLFAFGCSTAGAGRDGGPNGDGGDTGVIDRPDDVGVARGLIFDNGGRGNYEPLERCDGNGGCSAGKICFQVTADIALCDVSELSSTTTCSPDGGAGVPADMCGCNGSTCADGQVCINVGLEGGGGQFGRYNACVDTACTSASDCGAGTTCTPGSFILPTGYPNGVAAWGRCFQPLCTSDADCTDGSDGRCSLILQTPVQNGEVRIVAVRCVYPGTFDVSAPDPSLCAGTRPRQTARRDPPPVLGGFYYCPDLAR